MNEKGFTLIELLAVIVILAIIALIATPIILDIIKDSKVESKKRSAENYLDAVELAVANKNTKGKFNPDTCEMTGDSGTCTGEFDAVHCNNDNEETACTTADLKVKVDGEVPVRATIIFNNGSVSNETTITMGEITYKKEKDGLKEQPSESTQETNKTYNNGDIVFFDVKEGKGCTKYLEDNSITGYNGINGSVNQNSCLKFYAFLDDGNEKLKLLLDHNTTALIAWTTSGITTNANGPIDVINKLYEDTKEWNGTITPSNYKYNHSVGDRVYPIEYSRVPEYQDATEPYKARLITAQEVAQITGADKLLSWDETSTESAWYYFQDLSQNYATGVGSNCASIGCKYGWLYDRTDTSCTTYGCLNNSFPLTNGTNGYWTSSARASNSSGAWGVYYSAYLLSPDVNFISYYGVRPVIEVLKSNL